MRIGRCEGLHPDLAARRTLLCDRTGREKLAVFDLISRCAPIWVRGGLLLEQPPGAQGEGGL